MEEKLSGIVVSSVSYGESDKILGVLTLEKGVVSAICKGVKKAGAKLKFASEPFCFAEFLFSVRQNRRVVTGASLIDSFYPLRESVNKLYAASCVLEFAKRFEKENIVSPGLFLDAVDCLKNLAYKTGGEAAYLVRFYLSALKKAGFGLELNGCFKCGEQITGRAFFDYRTGGFYSEGCAENGAREIKFSTYAALKNIASGGVPDDKSAEDALKLIRYFIENRADENLSALNQTITVFSRGSTPKA